jgi:hypothetical protein
MMIRKIGHRVAVTAVAVALAAGGTIAFAGTAFADDHDCDSCSHGGHDGHGGRHIDYYRSNGGDGGNGGNSNANCAAPLGVSAGLMGQGGPVSQCNSNSGGGGDAGDGSD